MTDVTYKTSTGIVGFIQLSEVEFRAWKKFKGTLTIKEPCKRDNICNFKRYWKGYKILHNL